MERKRDWNDSLAVRRNQYTGGYDYEPSPAELWARKRNSSKFVLRGIEGNLKMQLKKAPLIPYEKALCELAIQSLNLLFNHWNSNNEQSKERHA